MEKGERASHCLAILLLLVTLGAATSFAQPLSGTLTIGSPPSDYASISLAVSDLNANGISAPVTFEIKSGNYDEQVTIEHFTRTGNATDLVTFKPVFGTVVNWEYSGATSSTNWIVKVDSAQYIKFRNLNFDATEPGGTYGRLVVLDESEYITFEICEFTGFPGASSSTGTLVRINSSGGTSEYISFLENEFLYGYRGIRSNVLGGQARDTYIYGNHFGSQYDGAIYMSAAVGTVIDSNFVNDGAISDVGYQAIFSDGALEITRNEVDLQKGGDGIWISTTEIGGTTTPKLVANNMVAMRGVNADRGIYVPANNSDIYHNTVWMRRAGSALALGANRTGIDVRNNVLVNTGGGYALEAFDPGAIETSEYNILYSDGAFPVHWDGTDYANLTDYKEDSGNDILSFDVSVTFVDTVGGSDLHLASPSDDDVNLTAPEVGGITTDFDGDPRGSFTVTRGADEGIEQLPLDNGDTSEGFYRVAGGMPREFATPTEAIKNLNLRGIKGDVTFRVRVGTFTLGRRIDFVNHSGADALAKTATSTDTVLFRAANPNNRPTFEHASDRTENNWVVKVVDADRVRFDGINLEANGTPPYGRALVLEGDVDDFSISNCEITGLTGETSTLAALVFSDEFEQDRTEIEHCTLTGGSYGVYLKTIGVGTRGEDTKINYNYFDDQTVAGMIVDHEDLEVIGDTVITTRPNATGIYLTGASKPTVTENVIRASGTGAVGLLLQNTSGRTTGLSLVANNFIGGRNIGLKLEGGARLHGIYHNTIRAVDSVLYLGDTGPTVSDSTLYIKNNILDNTSTGPALVVENGKDILESDFNNLNNTGGGTLVDWEGTLYATLGAYQGAVPLDANSVSTSVDFLAPGSADLHLDGASDGDATLVGTPLAAVVTDIDGEPRSGTQPYMGADEATPFTITLGMTVFLEGPFAAGLLGQGLNSAGYLASDATTHPYGGAPWNYPGLETVGAGYLSSPSTAIDWVYLKLYSGTLPNITAVDSTVGLLMRDGSIVSHIDTTQSVAFDVPAGFYIPAIFHRNHVPIIASAAANMAIPAPFYDFTSSMTQAYGTNPMKDLGGGDFGLFAGDVDADGQIIANDFNTWLVDTKVGATGYLPSDFSMDGQVNAADFNLWLANTKAGAASQIP